VRRQEGHRLTAPAVLSREEFFRKYHAVESRLTAAVSERMLDLAGVGPGMRVLDLATGPSPRRTPRCSTRFAPPA
jgi:hypothetical protein